MLTSQETTNIFKALIEAAPEIQSIGKSKQAYGYKYATLDCLIDMLRQVLPKHGLWFTQSPSRVGDKSTLTTRVIHNSGEWFEDSIEMTDTELQGKVNDTQKVGASITYYRRYALSAVFGVASDEDVDGNLNNIQQKPQQRPQSRPAQNQPQPQQQPQNAENQGQNIKPVLDKAIAVIGADYKARTDAGETKESILKSYANALKTDAVRQVKEMQSAEVIALASYLSRSQKGE